MTLAAYLTFLLGAAALVMSPGPDFIFALSRGLVHGWRGGVTAATGIALGLMTHTTVALLGVSALLATSDTAFDLMKLAGVVYLAYLSVRMLTGRDLQLPAVDGNVAVEPRLPLRKILRQGYLVNVLNPGAALTFAAYLPQFIPPEARSREAVFVLLAASLIAFAFSWFSIAGSFAGAFTQFMRSHPTVLKAMRLIFGTVLLLLAAGLLFMQRR